MIGLRQVSWVCHKLPRTRHLQPCTPCHRGQHILGALDFAGPKIALAPAPVDAKASSAAPTSQTLALGQQCSQVSSGDRKPSKVFIGAAPALGRRVPRRIAAVYLACSLPYGNLGHLLPPDGHVKTVRVGRSFECPNLPHMPAKSPRNT